MLGQPVSMLIRKSSASGCTKLRGGGDGDRPRADRDGKMLRKKGVVGKFVDSTAKGWPT